MKNLAKKFEGQGKRLCAIIATILICFSITACNNVLNINREPPVQITGGTVTFELEDLDHNDIYLVIINTSDLIVPSSNIGGIRNVSPVNSPEKSIGTPGNTLQRMDHIQEFNANPPPIDRAMQRSGILAASFVPAQLNDKKHFWVERYYGSGTWEQKQATLLATGTYGNIWVMNENIPSGASANKISATRAQEMAAKFDMLYPLTTNIFGYEYGGGPNGDGGRDSDKKIQILVYDILDGAGGQTNIGGFFWSKDYYTKAQLGSGYETNLAEIFYINTWIAVDNPDFTYSALIHEFQHMIHFNRKNVEQGVSSLTWYNEMLSMMAEDIIAPLISIDHTNSGHPISQRIPGFRSSYYKSGLTEWNDTLDDYATKFAFGAYLMRNFSGAELLKRMIENDKTGTESITLALQEVSAGMNFNQAFRRYGEAMIFNGSARPGGFLTFNETVKQTINLQDYTAYGFDIWDGSGLTVNPSINTMRPHSIVVQSKSEWKDRTGNLSITLNKPINPNVVLYPMVK